MLQAGTPPPGTLLNHEIMVAREASALDEDCRDRIKCMVVNSYPTVHDVNLQDHADQF